eukprot:6201093-Pleurochrysis_carterae.AAC.2
MSTSNGKMEGRYREEVREKAGLKDQTRVGSCDRKLCPEPCSSHDGVCRPTWAGTAWPLPLEQGGLRACGYEALTTPSVTCKGMRIGKANHRNSSEAPGRMKTKPGDNTSVPEANRKTLNFSHNSSSLAAIKRLLTRST